MDSMHVIGLYSVFQMCHLVLLGRLGVGVVAAVEGFSNDGSTTVIILTCNDLKSNPLKPNNPYRGLTAPLTSKR